MVEYKVTVTWNWKSTTICTISTHVSLATAEKCVEDYKRDHYKDIKTIILSVGSIDIIETWDLPECVINA